MTVARVHLAALLVLCAVPSTAHGDVVVGRNGCLDAEEARARLEAVLTRRLGDPGKVDVLVQAAAAAGGETAMTLRVATRSGRVLLDRSFRLAVGDCGSSTELLALVLDRFFTGLPIEEWSEASVAPFPDEIGVPRSRTADPGSSHLALAFVSAVSTSGEEGGTDLELGLRFDLGRTRWRFGGGALVRQGQQAKIGVEEVTTRFTLATAGLRFAARSWQTTLELRGGVVELLGIVPGMSPAKPWAEGAASLSWVGRYASVGLVASVSPPGGSEISVNNVSHRLEIPGFRVGISVAIPLVEQKP